MPDVEGEYPNQFLGLDAVQDTNAGACNQFSSPIKFSTAAGVGGAIVNSGSGVPTIGGNVGDLYFRTDFSGANTLIYVCSVAGAAGLATWVGKV